MKLLTLLFVASRLAAALPHGPDGDDDDMPVATPAPKPATSAPKPTTPSPSPAPKAPAGKTVTPAGCRKLSTDADWPAPEVWKKALPEVESDKKHAQNGTVAHPDYLLRAESVKDVQTAVKFVKEHNIRLTVINSGHDFLGRNDAPSGLSLDVSLLTGIRVLEEFKPTATGAEKPPKTINTIVPIPGKQAAVTFGVGISTQRLNNAIHPMKLLTVGAAHGSVMPAGGFGQMGGHGPVSNRYGLGSDQFLEFKVVTADGELKVANKVTNQDLFWALRGGGGGTFGVVVEATMKAYPDIPITMAEWSLNATETNSPGLWDAYSELYSHFVDFVEKNGMSGYFYIYPKSVTSVWMHQGEHAGKAKAQAIWDPIFKKLSAYPGITGHGVKIQEFDSFKGYFDQRFGSIDSGKKGPAPKAPWEQTGNRRLTRRHGPGMDMESPVANPIANLDSRLLGAEHFKNPNLTQYLKDAAPFVLGGSQAIMQGHLVGGGKVFKPDDDVSANPAWRKAYVHLIGYKVEGKASVESLRKLAPDSGAYGNEAFALEDNWKQSFWGSNYPKLSQLKTQYDPDNLFWSSPAINADLMEARNGRACKVSKPYTASRAPLSDNANNGRILTGRINRL